MGPDGNTLRTLGDLGVLGGSIPVSGRGSRATESRFRDFGLYRLLFRLGFGEVGGGGGTTESSQYTVDSIEGAHGCKSEAKSQKPRVKTGDEMRSGSGVPE